MPAALTANWINPLLFSWPVDDAVLEPLLPPGLIIDHWQGQAYLSLVGLRFEDLRVFGIPAFPRRYDEVNLRFYVRRPAHSGDCQPGVVFLRQLVPHRLTALAAHAIYGERFRTAPVGHEYRSGDAPGTTLTVCIAYHWEAQGRRQRFWAAADDSPMAVAPGSLEDFLTNRYYGYNRKPGSAARTYLLTRPPWTVRLASRWGTDCDFSQVCGGRLTDAMPKAPASVLLASGSRAAVSLPIPSRR